MVGKVRLSSPIPRIDPARGAVLSYTDPHVPMLDHGDLSALLFLQGYRRQDFVAG